MMSSRDRSPLPFPFCPHHCCVFALHPNTQKATASGVQVLEGMASWVTAAWAQLLTGAAVLLAMAAMAPLAGMAAAVAWSSHFLLGQVCKSVGVCRSFKYWDFEYQSLSLKQDFLASYE